MKGFLKSRFGIWLISTLAFIITRGITLTLRMTIRGEDKVHDVVMSGTPVILSLWHGRMFILIDKLRLNYPDRLKVATIASQSQDGELISQTLHKLGFYVARGSSTRGGIKASLQLLKVMKDGYNIAITVDGPKGPRYEVKPGIILLAKKTGYPILPVSASAYHAWVFKSWDRFLLPKPFSKVMVTAGSPLFIPSDATSEELEGYRNTLEKEMNEITLEADKQCHFRLN